MKPILAAALSLSLASQAQALSCIRPDIVQSYKDHAEATDSYVVVRGKFRFTPPKSRSDENNPKEQRIKARFEGVALSQRRFDTSFSRPVDIIFGCAGPWCGSVIPDTEAIAFVQQTDNGLVLDEGPCPWRVFYEPTKEQVDRLLSCHTSGICD